MNRFYAIAISLVLTLPFVALANGSIKDSVIDKTSGKPVAADWKKADDRIIGKIAKPQLVKMKATAESLHIFLEDSCFAGTGLQSVWHGEYRAEKTADGRQIKYGITCDFADRASDATLSILVNDLSPLTGDMVINNQDVMTLAVSAGVRNECPYFEKKSDNGKQGIWLVTSRPDMLPYMPVTRKEYLSMVIADLNATRERIIADVKSRTPVRSAEEQAAEKKSAIGLLSTRYSGTELEMRIRRYLEQYKSDEDYLKENIGRATADVDTTMHIVQRMLSHLAPATLAAPAIVSPVAREFEGFRDGEPGMVMLIRPNPVFFQSGAAQEKPQFFLVMWNSNSDSAATADIESLVSENLDTHILKEMLKK
ncbi:MAG TPA: hypothetical protein VG605_09960 [Puia sp.]|nr:hypothetical protein [Puia sp.]